MRSLSTEVNRFPASLRSKQSVRSRFLPAASSRNPASVPANIHLKTKKFILAHKKSAVCPLKGVLNIWYSEYGKNIDLTSYGGEVTPCIAPMATCLVSRVGGNGAVPHCGMVVLKSFLLAHEPDGYQSACALFSKLLGGVRYVICKKNALYRYPVCLGRLYLCFFRLFRQYDAAEAVGVG